MTSLSFVLILTGVLLNAAAQLLLKAGTNAVGHFDFHLDNAIPVGWKLATEPHIMSGVACYVVSLVAVSYTHLRAHETVLDLVCRLLLEKKKTETTQIVHGRDVHKRENQHEE